MFTYSKKDPIPPLVKVSDVAKLLSVSRQTVHHLIESGDLKASNISAEKKERQHVRITRNSLLGFYKNRFGQSLTAVLANPFEA